jgi:Na+(H+)/acetate symporter ActP
MIDPQIIALPVSFIVFIVVSILSEPVKTETIKNAFRHI